MTIEVGVFMDMGRLACERSHMGARNCAGAAMVPGEGIEPTLLSKPDFESGASTNFAIPAREEAGF